MKFNSLKVIFPNSLPHLKTSPPLDELAISLRVGGPLIY